MRRPLTLLLLAAVAAGAAAPAHASVTPSGLTTTASNGGAATRPNFTVGFSMSSSPSSDDPKKLTIDLPPGLMGDVQAIATCTTSQFGGDNCPAATDIGNVSSSVTALGLPISAPGDIYLLPAQGTEAARMGVVLRPLSGLLGNVYLTAPVRLRAADYGLRATIDNLPRTHSGLSIRITQMSMTLVGSASGGTPFISAPTSCDAAVTRVDVLAYDDAQTKSAQTSYTPSNCAAVPFSPSASIAVDPAVPDSPAQTSITLTIPSTATPRVQSQLRTATITLPEGMEVSPAAASSGLTACSDVSFGLGNGDPASCPDSAAVGDISIDNAQLGTLSGGVYLASPQPGQLLRLFILAQRSGAADDVRVKLAGSVTADPQTGRVTTQIDGIPRVPFRSMTMRLRGGPNAILRTPRTCTPGTLATSLVPWSGNAAATPSASLTLGGCGDASRFAPAVSIAASPSQAGASSALQMTITRPDGDARLAGARLSLPAGVLGKLAGVPQCPLADARAGSCPAASKVGSATATVGAGASPLTLPGDLYLTPPADGGLAGLVLHMNAQVGPLDLGRVAVPMELRLRAAAEGIDVTVADIPRRVSGIPLDLRAIAMTIDRADFILNPTSCANHPLDATLTSDLGATASVSAPFAATGCGGLAYSPRLRMALTGETRRNGHPAVTSRLTVAAGQANTQQVSLLLPDGMAPDSERLRNACPLATAIEGKCPAAARIGDASADTPALADELRGPVYFVMAPGAPLPQLLIRLGGPAQIDLLGKVSFEKGRSLVTFAGMPDVPLERFELSLAGGRRGVLTSSRDLCTGRAPEIDAGLLAHSGAKRTAEVQPAVEGCRAGTGGAKVTVALGALKRGRPTLRLTATAGDAPLRTVRVTLPAGVTVNRAKVSRLATVRGTSRGRKALKAKGRTITLTLGARGAKKAQLRLKAGALRTARKVRRARRVSVRVRATPTSGLATSLTLKVRPARR